MEYQIKLDVFSGPFDLLLHLIEKHEIDILDIPISTITEEYLFYIKNIEGLNIEQASEFLVMAATLMQIKAKMLVPQTASQDESSEEEEGDPRDELVRKLLEYKFFKELSQVLQEKEEQQNQVFFRGGGVFWDQEVGPPPSPLTGIGLEQLYLAFAEVLESVEDNARLDMAIPKKERPLRYYMQEIMTKVSLCDKLRFNELFEPERMTKSSLINCFMAVLELLRLHRIMVLQTQIFGEIVITKHPGEGEKIELDLSPGHH